MVCRICALKIQIKRQNVNNRHGNKKLVNSKNCSLYFSFSLYISCVNLWVDSESILIHISYVFDLSQDFFGLTISKEHH